MRQEASLRNICPDVVFLDIELRGGSGFELVPSIDPEKTKVIFVTGHDAYVEQALETGALACLTKPVTARCLAASLEKLKYVLYTKGG